jgi:hypothetical protein
MIAGRQIWIGDYKEPYEPGNLSLPSSDSDIYTGFLSTNVLLAAMIKVMICVWPVKKLLGPMFEPEKRSYGLWRSFSSSLESVLHDYARIMEVLYQSQIERQRAVPVFERQQSRSKRSP